jgi:hypothetical protein
MAKRLYTRRQVLKLVGAAIGAAATSGVAAVIKSLFVDRKVEPMQPIPTLTQPPTLTQEPTKPPTSTPTKTPSPTPTAPTIEEEKVIEIKERFVKILESRYPSIYEALFKNPPPFVIEDSSDFLLELPFITWEDSFGNSANIRDLSCYLKPNKKNPEIVKIRMSKENFNRLFWGSPPIGILISLETEYGPAVVFYFVLNEEVLRKTRGGGSRIKVLVRSKEPGKYKKTEIDGEVIIEIEVAPKINLDPTMPQIVGRNDLDEFRVLVDYSTVTPPDFTENPPQNIELIDKNAEIFTFQRLGLSLLLAKIVFYSLKGIKRNIFVRWLSEDLLERLEESARRGKEYLLSSVYKIFTDPSYKEALRRLIYELVEKWSKEA